LILNNRENWANTMNNNLPTDPWCIVQEGFQPGNQLDSEHVFGLGNGLIGQRANFEEFYTGDSFPGTYMSGIFANKPDIEEPFSNLPCWTTLKVWLNAEQLDLAVCEVKSFRRSLNMKQGLLERTFEVVTAQGHHIEVSVQRFLSMAQPEVGVIKYAVKSLGFLGHIAFSPVIDGDFDALYSPDCEPEWNVLQTRTQREVAHLWIQTRRTNYQVCEAMTYDFFKNNAQIKTNPTKIEKQKVAGFSFGTEMKVGDSVCVYKFVALLSSLNNPYQELTTRACSKALAAKSIGWNELVDENVSAWEQKWEDAGLKLTGKVETQQQAICNVFKKFHPCLGTKEK
jgi:maltose phosphorylase